MKPIGLFLFLTSLSVSSLWGAAPNKPAAPSAVTPVQTPAATAIPVQPTPTPARTNIKIDTSKALVIHKPMPSPSWGRVIQYHREQIFALSEGNRETLHEFVFQTEEGVVRTAVFHESASGNGTWEVTVWDQP